ncbi:MAG: hypothetical protein KAR45_13405 [Desulfobacteraceae bacterium]|nr:hypothetical protein [Desulfobacteraceae bacterium]
MNFQNKNRPAKNLYPKFKEAQENGELDDPESLELFMEFNEVLPLYVSMEDYMVDALSDNTKPVNNCEKLPEGILTV